MRMLKTDPIVFNANPNRDNAGKFAPGGGGGSGTLKKPKPNLGTKPQRPGFFRTAGRLLKAGAKGGALGVVGGAIGGGGTGALLGGSKGARAFAGLGAAAGAGEGIGWGMKNEWDKIKKEHKIGNSSVRMLKNDDMYGSDAMDPETITEKLKRKGKSALKAAIKGGIIGGIGGGIGAYGVYHLGKRYGRTGPSGRTYQHDFDVRLPSYRVRYDKVFPRAASGAFTVGNKRRRVCNRSVRMLISD